ncbi:MAG: chitosanase, partial [Pseudomonadota bacterium]|nr:chitosanase [Pseudomonadota bacterium]
RHLIEWVASLESGEPRYAAINPDGEFKGRFGRDHPYYQRAHMGLSYGIVPFTQDSGTLGQLLSAMHQRDGAYFETVFGPDWQELLQVTNASGPGSLENDNGRSARVQPVAGDDLWENGWLERFRLAGAHPPFQAAQNQLAAELFLEPALALAQHLGLASQRGVAMLYDRCAQMGVSQARHYVLEQLSPMRSEAQRSAALATLMANQEEASLMAFQRAEGLPADGQWNALTHARLLGALRERQQQGGEIPLVIPGYDEMLDTLVAVARGRPWEERLTQLRTDPELSDTPYSA